MHIVALACERQSGVYQMSLDEAMLETLRMQISEPMLMVRAYRWDRPTISLGVHQKSDDVPVLLERLSGVSDSMTAEVDIVRRPTGGRAILHGEDISYAFATNHPEILKHSLKASYRLFSDIIQETLKRLSLGVRYAADVTDDRTYTRSPACFETRTATDMLDLAGNKLTGSAQLRRAGGILQHGAVFLTPYGIEEDAFQQALLRSVAQAFGQTAEPCPPDLQQALESVRQLLEPAYQSSGGSPAKVSTTSGSQRAPASS